MRRGIALAWRCGVPVAVLGIALLGWPRQVQVRRYTIHYHPLRWSFGTYANSISERDLIECRAMGPISVAFLRPR